MAEENAKDFTVGLIVTGLLMFCLISFVVVFMLNNNPDNGLDADSQYIFEKTEANLSSKLVELPDDTNALLNISASTNPEGNFLGSRDSVATSFSVTGSGRGFWESTRLMISWVFSGTIGQMLLFVFGGLIGMLSIYYITKWIRVGS